MRNCSNNFRVNIMTPEEIMKLVTSKDGYIGHAMNIPHDWQNKIYELVLKYNQTSPADIKRREELLKPISLAWHTSTLELPSLTRVQ